MKGNKMSAILAILIMLSGALFIAVPHAVAQVPASSVEVVTTGLPGATITNGSPVDNSIVSTSSAYPPGYSFVVNIAVTNVVDLLSYTVGFYYNATVLNCTGVSDGGFLTAGQPATVTVVDIPGTIGVTNNHDNGTYTIWTAGVTANGVRSGSGNLLTIDFSIMKNYTTPYTGTLPGTPVPLVTLSSNAVTDPDITLVLIYQDGVTPITPLAADIYSGTIDLTVPPPYGPTADFTYTPTILYAGTAVTFTSTSTEAWSGTEFVPISSDTWYVNGTVQTAYDNLPTMIWTPPAAGLWNVTLLVDVNPALMPPSFEPTTAVHTELLTVASAPSGPYIDLTSQNWRYVDPITISPVPNGYGPETPCDLFRPGDSAQFYATVEYNGAPVASQLVSFQVDNATGAVLATGTGISNMSGIAVFTFRIPWPTTPMINNPAGYETLPEFGTWTGFASWQCGIQVNGTEPSEKTVNDTMPFKVGWGLWITSISVSSTDVSPTTYVRGVDSAIVKINVENDYMVPVPALVTATLYDNLLVPIDTPAYLFQTFPAGTWAAGSVTPVTFAAIPITVYAFVGTAYAAANCFTTWPSALGTPFCPQIGGWYSTAPASAVFTITK